MEQKAVATAEQVKAKALAEYEKAKAQGFFSHFGDYNKEILQPLMRVSSISVDAIKAELLGTLTLSPPNPEAGFVFCKPRVYSVIHAARRGYPSSLHCPLPVPRKRSAILTHAHARSVAEHADNVMALLLGIAEGLTVALLGGGYASLIWNGVIGYAIAYRLYWVLLCFQEPAQMKMYLYLIASYLFFTILFTFGAAQKFSLVAAAIYALKAFCNLQMLVSGVSLYKAKEGGSVGSMV